MQLYSIRLVGILGIVVAACGCDADAAGTKDPDTNLDETEVTMEVQGEVERLYQTEIQRAWTEKDGSVFDRLFTEDFTMALPSGTTLPRAQALEALNGGFTGLKGIRRYEAAIEDIDVTASEVSVLARVTLLLDYQGQNDALYTINRVVLYRDRFVRTPEGLRQKQSEQRSVQEILEPTTPGATPEALTPPVGEPPPSASELMAISAALDEHYIVYRQTWETGDFSFIAPFIADDFAGADLTGGVASKEQLRGIMEGFLSTPHQLTEHKVRYEQLSLESGKLTALVTFRIVAEFQPENDDPYTVSFLATYRDFFRWDPQTSSLPQIGGQQMNQSTTTARR